MSKRSNVLAERIEQGAEALATFAEGLSLDFIHMIDEKQCVE